MSATWTNRAYKLTDLNETKETKTYHIDSYTVTCKFLNCLIFDHIRSQADAFFSFLVRLIENNQDFQDQLKPDYTGDICVAKFDVVNGLQMPPGVQFRDRVREIMFYIHKNINYFATKIEFGPYTNKFLIASTSTYDKDFYVTFTLHEI